MENQSRRSGQGELSDSAKMLLQQILPPGFQGWSSLGLQTARAAILQMDALGGPPEPVLRTEKIAILGTDGKGPEGQLYIPAAAAPLPVFVYLHGGGWSLGSHTVVDSLARALANRARCAVLSLSYRLAPENKYPVALEDVYASLQWVVAHAEHFGLDATRLGVGGDSAGANLAAAVSLLCRDRGGPPLRFQLLAAPVLDHAYDNESYRQFGEGELRTLTRRDVIWFHELYTNTPEDLNTAYICPLKAESLAGLPETLILSPEIDPLAQEGLEFALKLEAAGVRVERKFYPGMFHGFTWATGVLPEAREAMEYSADAIRRVMQAVE